MIDSSQVSSSWSVLLQLDAKPLRHPVDEVEVGGDGGGIVDAGIGDPGGAQAGDVALGDLPGVRGELQGVIDQRPLPRLQRRTGRIAPQRIERRPVGALDTESLPVMDDSVVAPVERRDRHRDGLPFPAAQG
jgi:hypothetical protein